MSPDLAPVSSLMPEYRFLLACGRDPRLSTDTAQLTALIERGLDWEYLLHAAKEHRLLCLMFQRLSQLKLPQVPQNFTDRAAAHAKQIALRCMKLSAHLAELCQTFEQAQIPMISLKGPILGQLSLDSFTLRPSNDLDLLVPEAHKQAAVNLLRDKMGFDRDFHELSRLTPRRRRHFFKSENEVTLGLSDAGLIVDLHWRSSKFDRRLLCEKSGVWSRLQQIEFGGRKINYLGTEDLLIYLAAHGARHYWQRLFWLQDLATLTRRRPDLDWDHILRLAEETDSARPLVLGMALAHHWFDGPWPEPAAAYWRRNPRLHVMAQKIMALIFAKPLVRHFPPSLGAWDRARWVFDLNRSKAARLGIGFNFLFTPGRRDWKTIDLPDPLFPAYYLLRPIRLVLTYVLGRFGNSQTAEKH